VVGASLLSSTRWRNARWLVLAPHADDETLGVGALISEAAFEGRLAGIAYLTDGAGSHSHSDAASRSRLKAVRRVEAATACRRLTRTPLAPLFLDWPDAQPFEPGSPSWRAALLRLTSLCRRERVDAIAVTASAEPHCDHAAAGDLAQAVAATALRPVAVFEYCVWGDPPVTSRVFVTRAMEPGRRRSALAAHRSQLTPLFGVGFRLPLHQQAMPDRDRLYLRSRRGAS
jgi:LmbE family N-acetylglucosaminyl deacetylase